MNPSDKPNPERRSNNAMLCFCLGVGLCVASYFLGIGAVIGAAFSGGNPVGIAGSVFAAIALTMLAVAGFIMSLVGGVWMIVQVIADQRGDASEKRYRDVER